MIVIDNNVLVQLLTDRQASDQLSRYLQLQDQSLLIPAPVLAEFLAHDFQQRVIRFFAHKNSRSQIASFDEKAALICGDMAYRLNKEKKDKPKQQAKVDLQVVAIAQAAQAKIILTEDTGIKAIINTLALPLQALALADLPTDGPLFN